MTIGCLNIMNAVSFLEKDFNVVYPHLAYKNSEFIMNYDIMLLFDCRVPEISEQILKNCNIPIIGTPRYSKFEQMMILDAMDIKHPATYKPILNATNDDRNDILQVLLNEYDDADKLVLKAEHGARGLGQIIVDRNTLYEIIDLVQHSTLSVNEIAKKLVATYQTGSDVFRNDEEKNYIVNIIKDGQYHIEKYVKRLSEYRVIGFYGEEPIIIQRTCKEGEKWQANTSVTGEGKRVYAADLGADYYEKFKQISNKMCKYLNTPWLSIDIYVDGADCKMGVFEFQMQFGYNKVPKKELVYKINSSTRNIIDELYPNIK